MESIKVKTTLDAKNIGWKGSQLRCLLLTSMDKPVLQRTLTSIINQKSVSGLKVEFSNGFEYFPKGLINPKEIELDKANINVNSPIKYCNVLNKWWLKRNARTPVWDLVCTALINDTPGFILIEAKSHQNELLKTKDESGAIKGSPNRCKIEEALSVINSQYGYNLSADNYFQLSNRIAWSLKLASLGIPVVLIYLGCLETKEMSISKNDSLLYNDEQWEGIVTNYSKEVDFEDWGKIISGEKLKDDNIPVESSFFCPIIRSVNIQFEAGELSLNCSVV